MLPYSPLHHLLAADTAKTLVMTSGNVADEPIGYRDDDGRRAPGRANQVPADPHAHRRLGPARAAAPAAAAPLARARARGAGAARRRSCWPVEPSSRAPSAWPRARAAWPGHHIGDLRNELLRSSVGVAYFERLFAVAPQVVAHDLHPDYLSTTYALAREDVAHVGVQHHHPSGGGAGRAQQARPWGDLRRRTGYGLDGTAELLHQRPGRLRARRPSVARARRRPRGAPAVAHGLRVVQGAAPSPLPGIESRTWHAVAELGAHGAGRAGDDEHGPALRRRRRPLRPAHRGQLRGPGGGRARGDQRSLRAGRLSARRGGRRPRRPRDERPPSRFRWRPVTDRRAFIARSRAPPRRRAPRPPARAARRAGRRRGVAEPPAARAHRRCSRPRAARARAERLRPNDGATLRPGRRGRRPEGGSARRRGDERDELVVAVCHARGGAARFRRPTCGVGRQERDPEADPGRPGGSRRWTRRSASRRAGRWPEDSWLVRGPSRARAAATWAAELGGGREPAGQGRATRSPGELVGRTAAVSRDPPKAMSASCVTSQSRTWPRLPRSGRAAPSGWRAENACMSPGTKDSAAVVTAAIRSTRSLASDRLAGRLTALLQEPETSVAYGANSVACRGRRAHAAAVALRPAACPPRATGAVIAPTPWLRDNELVGAARHRSGADHRRGSCASGRVTDTDGTQSIDAKL